MAGSAIHPGGIPPKTWRQIEVRQQALFAEHDAELKRAGWFTRAQLLARLEAQAFREITGCEQSRWDLFSSGPVVH
jgi:hypothetical protein